MARLLAQLIGLLADIVAGWLAPLVGTAIFSSLASILIAANHWIGGIFILTTSALLVQYCIQQGALWQAVVWIIALGGYGILALITPAWALLWGLGLSVLALVIIWVVPGAVLPPARRFVTSAVIAAVILHTVLATVVGLKGFVFLAVLGLLALAVGSYIFSQSARPWEIRRAQRQTGRLLVTVGLLAILAGLTLPSISQLKFPKFSIPAPIDHFWSGLSAWTEVWALSAQRALIGEQAKTRSLEQMENTLRNAHRERWRRNIERLPSVPLDQREWEELGNPFDP